MKIYILLGIVILAIIIICTWMIIEAMKEEKKEWEFKERDRKLYEQMYCDCDDASPFFFMSETRCEECLKPIKK